MTNIKQSKNSKDQQSKIGDQQANQSTNKAVMLTELGNKLSKKKFKTKKQFTQKIGKFKIYKRCEKFQSQNQKFKS